MSIYIPGHAETDKLTSLGGALIGIQGPRLNDAVQFTPEEYDEYLRLTQQEYFLLKLKGVDLASHCRNCGAGKYPVPAHEYFTLFCVEKPWKGNVFDALYAYASVTKDPLQKSTLLKGLGELSQGHPGTSSLLAPKEGSEAVAFIVSSREIIDREKALTLAERINSIGSMGYAWEPFVMD